MTSPGPTAGTPNDPGPVSDRARVLIAPDSFKGTAAASRMAAAMGAGARRVGWADDQCPLSDGGEGFLDALRRARPGDPGRLHHARVHDPLGRLVTARWALRGTEAIIESAEATGLHLVGGPSGNDPVGASSRGVGELVLAALGAGARRVIIGVGGSATTDGGVGALEVIEAGGGLKDAALVVACDVATAFLDAADIFGPQKGASPAQVTYLRHRLAQVATGYRTRYGVEVTEVVGSGAAGGLAGAFAVLGASLVPGFDLVARALDVRRRLETADAVITGEGGLDPTSWTGKVVGSLVDCVGDIGGELGRAPIPLLIVAGSVARPIVLAAETTDTTNHGAESFDTVDLSERFGARRARRRPASCAGAVVATWLSDLGDPRLRQGAQPMSTAMSQARQQYQAATER